MKESRSSSISRVIVLAAAAFLLSSTLNAQTTPAAQTSASVTTLSLDDALRMAESQSEAVRIARAGLQRAEGQRMQARSQYFPQVFGSAGYTRTLKSQYSSLSSGAAVDTTKPPAPAPPCEDYLLGSDASIADRVAALETASRCASGLNPFAAFSSLPFGQANQYQVGLSLSQNVFTGGRVSAQNEAAAAGRRAADIELTAQRAQNILDVTQAYYDAALADRLVAITDASFTQTENVLRQVQLNKTVGNVSEFELLRAQVTRDNQRPLVIQRRSDREVAYLRLKQLLNIPLEQPVSLTTKIDNVDDLPGGIHVAGLRVGSADAPDTAAVNRSAVRQASENVRAQQQLVRVAKAQRLPSISLSSQYGAVAYPANGLPGSNDFRANWTIGVSTQIPLFTGGRIRGDELVAQGSLNEARARLQQVKEFASLDARVAINALNQARAAWEASRGTSEQASRAYQIAEVRYREGISTLVPNLPLQSGTSAQSAGGQTQTQQQPTQQTSPQQTQPNQQQGQQGTLANQQIPPAF
jgi:outer membrane protein TolC